MMYSLKIKISDAILYMLWFTSMAASFRTQVSFLCQYAVIGLCLVYLLRTFKIEWYPSRIFLLILPIFILVSYYTNCDYKATEWIRTVHFLVYLCVVIVAPYERVHFDGILHFIKNISLWFYGLGIYIQLLTPSLYALIMRVLFASKYTGTQYASDWVANNEDRLASGYCTGFTTDSAATAYFMLLGLIIILCNILYQRRKMQKKEIFEIIYLLIAITMTGKRSAILFGALSLFIVYISSARSRELLIKSIKIFLFCLAAFFMCYIIYLEFGTGNAVGRLVASIFDYYAGEDVTSYRSALNIYTWGYIHESPITGIGWGNMITRNYINYNLAINGHNVYLQFWAECGLIGLIVLMLYFVFILIRAILVLRRCVKTNSPMIVMVQTALFVQIYIMTYAYTGNPLYSATYMSPYFISVFLVEYCNKKLVRRSS